VAAGLIGTSAGNEVEPVPDTGLWLPIRGDLPLREGVPRGVVEIGLGCMLVVETGFFEQPAAFLGVFRGRLDQPSVSISYSADNRE
jgi:hypothetical protein